MKKNTLLLGCLFGLASMAFPASAQVPDEVNLTFARTGATAADVTVSVTDGDGTAIPGAIATLTSSHNFKTSGTNITEGILCPDVNATTNPTIVLTLNIAGLSEGFTFDAVDATIWPLNGTGALQQLGDGKVRQWNFGLTQGADEASLADFASITDYEVNNAQPSVPEFTTETPVTTSGTTLSLQLTITKGTENVGCFVGLESLRLYNSANEGEEGEEPAEEGTYTVDLAHGAFGTGNATGTYFAEWASTAEPTLTLTCGANNMAPGTDNQLLIYQGQRGNTYTLSVPRGWLIASYSFDFTNADAAENMTITPAGKSAVTCEGSATATVSVDGINAMTASFDISSASGSVKAAALSDFVVKIVEDPNADDAPKMQEIFSSETGGNIPYRIPAVTRQPDGSLLIVADYRYSRADIGGGNGHIDIKGRISHDNGATWGDEILIADGNGISGDHACGYGDPTLVTDSTTGRILMMCCTGHVGYGASTRQNPLRTARLYSDDGGLTWTQPEDVTEEIYGLFDAEDGTSIPSLFFGSGRIAQSHLIKVGDYYRLYAALCTRSGNRVIYSDDFGQTWHALGGINARPAPSGDEPKCEELPDGRVLLSSRMNGGRYFNIFTYTDMEKAEGSWGSAVASNQQEGGVTVLNNSTNGEILIIPVVRNADGQKMYLALQSIPFGSGRANVGIWYKGLETYSDYSTPVTFASNWEGSYQVSKLSSCYSTMMMQADGKLAFVYEETTPTAVSGGYTIVYTPLDIETITDSAYTFDQSVDRAAFLTDGVDDLTASLKTTGYVGSISEEGLDDVVKAVETFKATPTMDNYFSIVEAMGSKDKLIVFDPAKVYRIYSPRAEEALTSFNIRKVTNGSFTGNVISSEDFESNDYSALWKFEGSEADGYKLKNLNAEAYYAAAADNAKMADTDAASVLTIGAGTASDNWTLAVTNNTALGENVYLNARHYDGPNGNPSSHAVGTWRNGASDAGNLWMLQQVDSVTTTLGEDGYAAIDLPFAVRLPEGLTAYTTLGEEKAALVLKAIESDVLPAHSPVLLGGNAGTYALTILDGNTVEPLATGFDGVTVRSIVSSDANRYLLGVEEGTGEAVFNLTTSTNIAANTAYYATTTEGVDAFTLTTNTVGINGLTTGTEKGATFYDLSGRRVAKPVHGIFVTGTGKKIVIK